MLSAGYSHQPFFTVPTLESVRAAVANASVFFVAPNFNLRVGICGTDMESLALEYKLYHESLSGRRDSYEIYYAECNRVNRFARASQRSSAAGGSGSVAGAGKQTSEENGKNGGPKASNTNTRGNASSSQKVQVSCSSSRKSITSGSQKVKKPKQDKVLYDADVVHRIR